MSAPGKEIEAPLQQALTVSLIELADGSRIAVVSPSLKLENLNIERLLELNNYDALLQHVPALAETVAKSYIQRANNEVYSQQS